MKIGSSEILKNIDRHCIEELEIPGLILMENAAIKVLKHLDTDIADKYVIVCGNGNNGGDGYAVARHLKALGKSLEIFMVGDKKMSPDCSRNYEIIRNIGLKVKSIANTDDLSDLKDALEEADLVVDAIFGTGITRKLEELYVYCISVINENSTNIISIDVPSGINSNTGEMMGNAIKAKKTVTLELYKRGFVNNRVHKYTGEIILESIGIPEEIVDLYHQKEYITSLKDVNEAIPKRDKTSHKGDYGRLFILAGSKDFIGAAYLTTKAAVMAGTGLVTLGCKNEIQNILSGKLTEAMTYGYDNINELKEKLNTSSAIAIGPGLGNGEETLELLKEVLSQGEKSIIIDADGLNVLSKDLSLLKDAKAKIILTPHPGEMSRLTGLEIDFINENRIKVSKEFAMEHKVIVLLKGYNTVITDGESVYINPTGNSSMASGGMGDALTGIIASLCAQGCKALEAAYTGAYLHGYAGDILSKDRYSVNAEAIIDQLPYVLKSLES